MAHVVVLASDDKVERSNTYVSVKLHLRDGRTEVRPSLRWSLRLTK